MLGNGIGGLCIQILYILRLMWTVQREYIEPVGSLQLRFLASDSCLSYAGFLNALAEEATFRNLIQEEMRAAPSTNLGISSAPSTFKEFRYASSAY